MEPAKQTKCTARLMFDCDRFLPDIHCRYFLESRLQPLRCTYRTDGQCLHVGAQKEAMKKAEG